MKTVLSYVRESDRTETNVTIDGRFVGRLSFEPEAFDNFGDLLKLGLLELHRNDPRTVKTHTLEMVDVTNQGAFRG